MRKQFIDFSIRPFCSLKITHSRKEFSEDMSSKTLDQVNFDRYGGTWWEFGSYPLKWEANCDRSTAEYQFDSVKKVLKVTNNCWKDGKISYSRTGEAYVPNMNDQGKLRLNFTDGLPSDGESDYYIHWTDYDNYAIVGVPSGEYFWILTRKEKIPRSEIPRIVKLVQTYGYDIDRVSIPDDALA